MDQDQLILSHLDLAYSIAYKFRDKGLPLEDLKQEALLGLVRAAEDFDPSLGNQFSTYASFWIRKMLLEALRREGKTGLHAGELDEASLSDISAQEQQQDDLQLPEAMPELEKRVLSLSFGEKLSLKEISGQLGLTVERVKQLKQKALRRLRAILAAPPDCV